MKVLLISHNPICTNNNMGKTFLSLFSEFDDAELCQLYIHPTCPDIQIRHSYYRITDKEALKSVFTFRAPGGEINPSAEKRETDVPAPKRESNAASCLGRDAVWKLSHWYSKGLRSWLDREAPTHIFLAPGYAKFIYDIALRISRDYKLPIVTYICDDYYFVRTPKSILGKIYLSLLRKKTEDLMKKTVCLVAICDEIKDLYSEKFGVEAVTLMTGSEMPRLRYVDRVPTSVSYFGNVGCNRYLSLCDIGRSLEDINLREGTAYILKVYTNEQDPAILKALSAIPTIRLCGFATGDTFRQAMSEADLLLHTEAFDEESMDLVKHSVSTKIADILASGIPMVAYGPAELASMKHLARHDCALVATSKGNLLCALMKAFSDEKARKDAVTRAGITMKRYHDRKKNSQELKEIMRGRYYDTT